MSTIKELREQIVILNNKIDCLVKILDSQNQNTEKKNVEKKNVEKKNIEKNTDGRKRDPEQVRKWKRTYYHKHKVRVQCECGASVFDLKAHLKTKKHATMKIEK